MQLMWRLKKGRGKVLRHAECGVVPELVIQGLGA